MRYLLQNITLLAILGALQLTVQAAPAKQDRVDLRSIASARQASVKQLIDIVESASRKPKLLWDDSIHMNAAISLLGSYRATEAVPLLIRLIDVETASLNSSLTPLNNFPSCNALIQIGNPSVSAILDALKEEQEVSERKLRLYAYIIRSIDGTDVGSYRLQLAKKGVTGTQKINTLNLIDVYNRNESGIQVWKAIMEGDSKPMDQ